MYNLIFIYFVITQSIGAFFGVCIPTPMRPKPFFGIFFYYVFKNFCVISPVTEILIKVL